MTCYSLHNAKNPGIPNTNTPNLELPTGAPNPGACTTRPLNANIPNPRTPNTNTHNPGTAFNETLNLCNNSHFPRKY